MKNLKKKPIQLDQDSTSIRIITIGIKELIIFCLRKSDFNIIYIIIILLLLYYKKN